MIDPTTGLDIGQSMVSGGSLTGQVTMDALGSAGYDESQVPLLYDMASSLPTATVTTMWNVGRVRNTIMGGGSSLESRLSNSIFSRGRRGQAFSYRPGSGSGGMFRGGIPQTLKPRRLKRAANIDPTAYGDKSGIYTPFNFLAGAGNFGVKNIDRLPIIGKSLAEKMTNMAGQGIDIKNDKAFSPGTLGRIATGFDIGNMSERRLKKRMHNIHAAISDISPDYYNNTFKGIMNSARYADDFEYARGAMQAGIGSGNMGWISGRVSGFFDAAEATYQGRGAVLEGLKAATQSGSHYARGLQLGEEAFSQGGRFAKGITGKAIGSGAARGALKGAGTAGWILLAHDMAVLSGKVIGRGIETAFDAAKSLKGSLDKPVMGMGYRDNSVAATSRQRGVMAIQNSRLNMRSALGSEASAMYAHFG